MTPRSNAAKVSDELRKEITEKITKQLLRWDSGDTKELFDKKLFGEHEQEMRLLFEDCGHHITEKPFKFLFGKEEYKAVFPWIKTSDIPAGFRVSIVSASEPKLADKVDFPVRRELNEIIGGMRLMLSETISYARRGGAKGLKTLEGTYSETAGDPLFVSYSAKTAEDFINGMNVILDKDLQINPELIRAR